MEHLLMDADSDLKPILKCKSSLTYDLLHYPLEGVFLSKANAIKHSDDLSMVVESCQDKDGRSAIFRGSTGITRTVTYANDGQIDSIKDVGNLNVKSSRNELLGGTADVQMQYQATWKNANQPDHSADKIPELQFNEEGVAKLTENDNEGFPNLEITGEGTIQSTAADGTIKTWKLNGEKQTSRSTKDYELTEIDNLHGERKIRIRYRNGSQLELFTGWEKTEAGTRSNKLISEFTAHSNGGFIRLHETPAGKTLKEALSPAGLSSLTYEDQPFPGSNRRTFGNGAFSILWYDSKSDKPQYDIRTDRDSLGDWIYRRLKRHFLDIRNQ